MARTITHDTHTGPGLLRLRLPAGRITVTAAKDHRRATVRLTPQRADDQAAAEAIERTEVTQSGESLAITVPSPGGAAMTQTVIQSGGSVFVAQNLRVVSGSTTIIGGGGTVITTGSGGDIDAEVKVPAGHRVELDTGAGDVASIGRLAGLHVETGSGHIVFTEADSADLVTGSGRINAGQVGALQARTGSGDIIVRAASGSTTLHTGCGHIQVHLSADVRLRARTGSGDITATAAPGIRIDRSGMRTGFGNIYTR